MKIKNSIAAVSYKVMDGMFYDDIKADFLADKHSVTLDNEEWAELMTVWESDWDDNPDDPTNILYGDVSGSECLAVLPYADDFQEMDECLGGYFPPVTLYTNENKDFYILVQSEY